MARTAIETLLRMLDQAYRTDPFSALRKNIASVRPEEWDIRPSTWSTAEFGDDPELSICDIALHTGAKYMYVDRAFGEATMEWGDIKPPQSRSIEDVLAWLDEAHRLMIEGLASLDDDAPPRRAATSALAYADAARSLITIITNHDLYHSGEINRQRALIRGAEGWDRK